MDDILLYDAKNIKQKLNDALKKTTLSVYGLRNQINEKYNCDLNKDTFRKLFSYTDSNINFRYLFYVCKYLKIDLNSLCFNHELQYSGIEKSINFELEKGNYLLLLEQHQETPDRLVVDKDDDGEYKITYYRLNNGHHNLVPIYYSSRIIVGNQRMDVYFDYDNISPIFVLHFNNDKLKKAKALKVFFYSGLITYYQGQNCSKFILMKDRENFDDKREYYLSLLKIFPYSVLINRQTLNELYKKDSNVKYFIDILTSLKSIYYFSNYCFFDSKIFEIFNDNYNNFNYTSNLGNMNLDVIIKGYLKTFFYSENESVLTTEISNFQKKYLEDQ